MTKEELKKEAIQYAVDYPTNYGKGYKHKDLRIAYLAGAEPREKQIQIDAEQIRALQKQNGELTDENERLKGDLELWESGACRATNLDKCGVVKELEAQIEKLIDFVLSKTECCDVCPITDTCINSEGTCPYAGILAKGEEEVTREWIMQFISKEIKEK